MVQKSLIERKQQPQLFVDISVPRNIDPKIGEISNAYLYNIDDLQNMVEENQHTRAIEAQKAEQIITIETGSFLKELEHKNYSPMIQQLQAKFSRLLENEWKKSFPEISQEKRDIFLQSVQQKFLSSPIRYLKEEDKSFEEKLATMKKMFEINSDDES